MKDFRIIVTNDRKDYELKIRKNLDEGYKMINSNLATMRPIQNKITAVLDETKVNLYFYAYMEKEI